MWRLRQIIRNPLKCCVKTELKKIHKFSTLENISVFNATSKGFSWRNHVIL